MAVSLCHVGHVSRNECCLVCSVRIENSLSEKEAVIYHGYTLTTKIAFRDVIHAINVRFSGNYRGIAKGGKLASRPFS